MSERVEKLISLFKTKLPSFAIKYKTESTLMKIIGFLMFFNRKFMTNYTTTLGSTVYFPTREYLDKNPRSALIIMAHEYRHARDANKISSFLFGFLYLIPQILAPFMLLLIPISVVLALILFILFLCPLPAPFRAYYEYKGYAINLLVTDKLLKEMGVLPKNRLAILRANAARYNKIFTGSGYYFMWPFGIKNKLKKTIATIEDGTILKKRPNLSRNI